MSAQKTRVQTSLRGQDDQLNSLSGESGFTIKGNAQDEHQKPKKTSVRGEEDGPFRGNENISWAGKHI